MLDEADPILADLFTTAQRPSDDVQFMAALFHKLDRVRRRRTRNRIVMTVLALVAVATLAPVILETTASAARSIGEVSALAEPYAGWVISPMGWAVSMAIGLAVMFRIMPRARFR